MNDLSLAVIDGEPRIDSCSIAQQLGVEHESFRKIIRDYQADFEEFGVCRFEIAKPPADSAGDRPEKYTLLNEDQSYLGLTYCQNTEQARTLKKKLVRTFGDYRRNQALHHSAPIPDLAAIASSLRLTLVEGEACMDSRHMAALLRMPHRTLQRVVHRHLTALLALGPLESRVEVTRWVGLRRVHYDRFQLLNPDQSYLLMSLAQPGARRIDAKRSLVQTFADYRKRSNPATLNLPSLASADYRGLAAKIDESVYLTSNALVVGGA